MVASSQVLSKCELSALASHRRARLPLYITTTGGLTAWMGLTNLSPVIGLSDPGILQGGIKAIGTKSGEIRLKRSIAGHG